MEQKMNEEAMKQVHGGAEERVVSASGEEELKKALDEAQISLSETDLAKRPVNAESVGTSCSSCQKKRMRIKIMC